MKDRSKKQQIHGNYKSLPYAFVLPGMILFVLIVVLPVIQTFVLSLTDWDGISPLNLHSFVGFSNYTQAFTTPQLLTGLKNNILFAIVGVSIPIILGLAQASVIVNSKIKFKNLFQIILFLPQLLSSIVMSIMWLAIYDPVNGVLNNLLKMLGLGKMAVPWLGLSSTAIYAILIIGVWGGCGFNTLIYCSAIRAVDPAMFEAATIDGAGSLQKFWWITIPTIRKTTTTLLLFSLIGAFNQFDLVYQMTQGGPGYSTYVISYDIYESAFVGNRVGFACAVAIILAGLIFLVSRVFLHFREDE